MSVDLAPIYLRAANVIRTNGHYQGAYFEPSPESGVGIQLVPTECPVCIAGALSIAISGNPVPPEGIDEDGANYDKIAGRLADLMHISTDPDPQPIGRLAAWNDAPDRTAEQVIAAFEAAAKAVA